MELRHLRYFVAVAESKSLTLAAEHVLHTTQPSLSRQIRDLEDEIGTPLFHEVRAVWPLPKQGERFWAMRSRSWPRLRLRRKQRDGWDSRPSLAFRWAF